MTEPSVGHKEIIKAFINISGVRTVAVNDIVNVHISTNLNPDTLKEIFDKELEFRNKHSDIEFDFRVTK